MSYKVTVQNKEFVITTDIAKYKKCIINNIIKYGGELKFETDPVIFEKFILMIISDRKITFDYIRINMNGLYKNNFNSIIDYMTEVINELKYFMLYNDTKLKNHYKSINNINEYMSIAYKMQFMINKIEFDLENRIDDTKKVETLCYYDKHLSDMNCLDDLYDIIKDKLKKYKYKGSIQLLNYENNYDDDEDTYSNLTLDLSYYDAIFREIKKIDNSKDSEILKKWITYVVINDIDSIEDKTNGLNITFEKIFDLIKKYKIKSQYELFSQLEPKEIIKQNAVYKDDSSFFKYIAIVVYPKL